MLPLSLLLLLAISLVSALKLLLPSGRSWRILQRLAKARQLLPAWSSLQELQYIISGIEARSGVRFNCLTRATALAFVSRLFGSSAVVVLGVSKDSLQKGMAHAWVEDGSKESAEERALYVPLTQ